jgi:uncharacterized protein
VKTIGEPSLTQGKDGLVRARVLVTCEHGALTVGMAIDGKGILQGLALLAPDGAPSWTPPSYANPKKFEEQEVMVGSGLLAVPGTLSLPHGHRKWPGVVLLPPMGPLDRDETNGSNKPLKDLAWGLASRGVAVLRFDMVTYAHSQQVAKMRDFMMTDEYVPYTVAAVNLLKLQPRVDEARIFVLGHSMGGKVAPRVATAEPSIAGLVIMAGDTQPMQRSAIRVARYLAQLSPGPASEMAVEMMTRQAALVDSPELSPLTEARELPFGLSGSYWLDLRSYDPVSAAAALDKPMFILQGGRDYQVTVEDDLSRWKEGLSHRPDVTIRVYDADNHLLSRRGSVHACGIRPGATRRSCRGCRHRQMAEATSRDVRSPCFQSPSLQAVTRRYEFSLSHNPDHTGLETRHALLDGRSGSLCSGAHPPEPPENHSRTRKVA